MPETSKGQDIFNILSSCLETKDLSWERCVGICTDDAPSVVGSISGFASLAKKNLYFVTTQCFIQREVLV
jgi:hypothetical protein